jgi:DNA-binding MarR family transcriptional regulator
MSHVIAYELVKATPKEASVGAVGAAGAVGAETALRRGALRLARRLQAERAPGALPLLKVSLLAHLHRRGPLHPGALAAAERLQPQSLTRTLAALERDGLIRRDLDPADGRRSVLTLTPAGAEILREEMRGGDRWLASNLAARCTPAERDLLRLAGELMEQLADSP